MPTVEPITNEELAVQMASMARRLEAWKAPDPSDQTMPGLRTEYGRGYVEHAMERAAAALADAANAGYHFLGIDAFDPTAFRRRG